MEKTRADEGATDDPQAGHHPGLQDEGCSGSPDGLQSQPEGYETRVDSQGRRVGPLSEAES
jgi:hypothetical protein